MNISFAGAVHYFTGVDISHSPCGRELNFMGQLANLTHHFPQVGKITIMGISILSFWASAVLLLPINVSSSVKLDLDFSLKALVRRIVAIWKETMFSEFGMRVWIAVLINFCWMWYVGKEVHLQKQEEQLIQALGGIAFFRDITHIKDVQNERDLRHLELIDMQQEPIRAGFLPDGRFFIAFQIQDIVVQKPVVSVLCQKKWSLFNMNSSNWEVLGKQKVAIGRGKFQEKMDNLTKLLSFTHPSHELIPFPGNNIIIERVKASGFNDRKWVHIALIWTHLRSLNRESFHAAQL